MTKINIPLDDKVSFRLVTPIGYDSRMTPTPSTADQITGACDGTEAMSLRRPKHTE